MKPLRVTFTLERPMHPPEMPIHLDALLAWAAVREAEEIGDPDPLAAQERLPLQHEDGPGGAVWCASQVVLSQQGPPQQIFRTKRFEVAPMALAKDRVYAGGANVLTQGTGPFKSFVLPTSVIWSPTAMAWCLGEADRMTELLSRVRSLGKHRGIMLGAITSCTVVEDASARARWRLRVMPRPVEGYVEIEAVTRPPYWQSVRRQPAWMPLQLPEVDHV